MASTVAMVGRVSLPVRTLTTVGSDTFDNLARAFRLIPSCRRRRSSFRRRVIADSLSKTIKAQLHLLSYAISIPRQMLSHTTTNTSTAGRKITASHFYNATCSETYFAVLSRSSSERNGGRGIESPETPGTATNGVRSIKSNAINDIRATATYRHVRLAFSCAAAVFQECVAAHQHDRADRQTLQR